MYELVDSLEAKLRNRNKSEAAILEMIGRHLDSFAGLNGRNPRLTWNQICGKRFHAMFFIVTREVILESCGAHKSIQVRARPLFMRATLNEMTRNLHVEVMTNLMARNM